MRKIIPVIFVLLFSVSLVSAVKIESCKSYGKDKWYCDDDDICVCRISGDCSNGRLLVYEDDIRDLLCMPKIVNGYADIDLDDCWSPSGEIRVRADCDEGQSSEKTIDIVSDGGDGDSGTTTTTTTIISCNYVCQVTCTDDNNPPFCYRRISHGTAGCPGGAVCCESVLKTCPQSQTETTLPRDKTCPYGCCVDMPGYEYKPCYGGLVCCNHLCKESCGGSGFEISKSLIFWIILASVLPIVAFLIFIWRKSSGGNIPEY